MRRSGRSRQYRRKEDPISYKKLLNARGCDSVKDGPVGKAGTLASLTKGKALSESDEGRFKTFGTDFAVNLS